MERQIFFAEKPQPMDWGKKKIVPLNINEEPYIEDGKKKTGYRADLVKKVDEPLTVDNIVLAATNEEFGEDAQKRIMLKFSKQGDAEVEKYKAFVAEVTQAALAAGYVYATEDNKSE